MFSHPLLEGDTPSTPICRGVMAREGLVQGMGLPVQSRIERVVEPRKVCCPGCCSLFNIFLWNGSIVMFEEEGFELGGFSNVVNVGGDGSGGELDLEGGMCGDGGVVDYPEVVNVGEELGLTKM